MDEVEELRLGSNDVAKLSSKHHIETSPSYDSKVNK